ncbi:basic helix-loop-helix transcription factor scleraxis [Drosophila albomicans]|uniref:Basic helix-loop-helix transcription factor scleraxis n=1 Tax=Drosophila albomicans TaxID=7291 RepID=A0A6P8Y5E5_DROAB|nr:basic helix-loop-helix transcription factor scleraxis [Drosophila albomicans]
MDINIKSNNLPLDQLPSYYFSAFGNVENTEDNVSGISGDSQDSFTGNSRSRVPAAPRQKINARERYRTFNVNAAYEALRGLIPTEPVNRKLSKIEIIRLASSYITHLRNILHAGTDRQPCLTHKWENNMECVDNESRFIERVSICTFCLRPRLALSK